MLSTLLLLGILSCLTKGSVLSLNEPLSFTLVFSSFIRDQADPLFFSGKVLTLSVIALFIKLALHQPVPMPSSAMLPCLFYLMV